MALIMMMIVVIFLTTIELAWIIIQDIITPPIIFLEIDQFLEIFGFFLLILIGIELLELTFRMIRNYFPYIPCRTIYPQFMTL